jgi:hypothetical protein
MNIFSEYRFLPENAVLPDSALKVIAIHSDGFYFLAHDANQIFYALLVGAKKGFTFDEANNFVAQHAGIQYLSFTKVLIHPETSVPVAPELLLANTAQQLFEFCEPIDPLCELIETNVSDFSLISSFKLALLENIRQHRLPIFDWAAIWLRKTVQFANPSTNRVHVHVLPSSFWVSAFFDGKMQLFNSFAYEAKSDFLYFLLGSVKAAGIMPDAVALRLSGEIAPSSLLAVAVHPYFASVEYDAAHFIANEESRMLSMQFYTLFDSSL